MKRFLINLFRGFITDLWMLPLAIGLAIFAEEVTTFLQRFPMLTYEKAAAAVPTTIVWLLMLVVVRVYMYAQFWDLYPDMMMRRKNQIWQDLTGWQKFSLFHLRFALLILVWAILYKEML